MLSLNGTSTIESNKNGAISASDTTLVLNGMISFTNNKGSNSYVDGGSGGGDNSTLFILPDTTVNWDNNHANLRGAIYVFDDNSNPVITVVKFSLKSKENVSFNSLARICLMVLMFNLFSRTTLLI